MGVYLVRHAVALGRSEWPRADELRPLSKKGQRQARALVDLLAAADVRRFLSSPAVRCRQTVEPAAAKLGLPVKDAPALLEDSPVDGAVEVVRAAAAHKGDTVLCSHGDLIPDVLRRLCAEGLDLEGGLRFAKGSAWHLTGKGGRLDRGRYHPPPD